VAVDNRVELRRAGDGQPAVGWPASPAAIAAAGREAGEARFSPAVPVGGDELSNPPGPAGSAAHGFCRRGRVSERGQGSGLGQGRWLNDPQTCRGGRCYQHRPPPQRHRRHGRRPAVAAGTSVRLSTRSLPRSSARVGHRRLGNPREQRFPAQQQRRHTYGSWGQRGPHRSGGFGV